MLYHQMHDVQNDDPFDHLLNIDPNNPLNIDPPNPYLHGSFNNPPDRANYIGPDTDTGYQPQAQRPQFPPTPAITGLNTDSVSLAENCSFCDSCEVNLQQGFTFLKFSHGKWQC